jgi:hypothetical protein
MAAFDGTENISLSRTSLRLMGTARIYFISKTIRFVILQVHFCNSLVLALLLLHVGFGASHLPKSPFTHIK